MTEYYLKTSPSITHIINQHLHRFWKSTIPLLLGFYAGYEQSMILLTLAAVPVIIDLNSISDNLKAVKIPIPHKNLK